MKPSWEDAPKWAEWLAMDGDGWWAWHENRPNWVEEDDEWIAPDGDVLIAGDTPDHSGIDWDFAYSTLEERPTKN